MKSVFIIKDRLMKPYMVVTVLPGGTEFKPLTSSARDLVKFFEKDYLNTPIKKEELIQALDATMEIEGPMPLNGATRAKISALTSSSSEEPKATDEKTLPVISLSDVVLTDVTDDEFFNVISYKASAFLAERTRTSVQYEIKGVRAVWDPSLAIPGTDRRGGWRCPVGTRYGGQITDRFGRSCGWGVARRIANEIADIGERLENVDDRRRGRRLERRNNRMARRLAQDAGQGGRVERGARRIAEALDGGNKPSAESIKPQRGQGAGRRRGRLMDDIVEGFRQGQRDIIEAGRPRVQEVVAPEAPAAPRRPRQPRLRPSEQRRMEREIIEPGAPRTAEPAAPRRPRQPQARRPRQPQVEPRLTPQQAGDAQVSENFPDYVNRKYGEYARNVRQINEGGGNAGMLTRREWFEINKDNLRGAWGGVHGREAPQDFEPPAPRRRPAGRAPRRRAATANAARSATRRPKPADVPEPAPAKPARATRRVNSGPTDAFEHAGVRFRGMDAARRRADLLARRENEPHHVVKYNDDLALYILNDAQLDKLRNNGSLDGKYEVLERRDPPAAPRAMPPQRPVVQAVNPADIDTKPPSRKKDYRNEIGALGADGLPDVGNVPVGNKNINDKPQAVEFLKNGGSIADVPDDFLVYAIRQNSTGNNARFVAQRLDRQGVNDTIKYKDNTNGKIYYLKYHSGPRAQNEDVHEIVGNNIAGRMGMPVGHYRLDGVSDDRRHRAVLLEDVRNYLEGDVQPPAGGGARISTADRVRASLLDFAIVNIDRHGGNFFQVVQNGKNRFAPIDPSLGFDAEWGGVAFENITPNEQGLRSFLRNPVGGGRNNMLSSLRDDFNAGRASRDEVVAAIASVQRSLREAEAKNPYRAFAEKAKGFADVTGQEQMRNVLNRKLVDKPEARLKFIADVDPSRLADIILGR